jgi:hypothetical protein
MNNKYRATLNGFWCRTASRDNVGNWDGKGDEVMFVTTTRIVEGTLGYTHPLVARSQLAENPVNHGCRRDACLRLCVGNRHAEAFFDGQDQLHTVESHRVRTLKPQRSTQPHGPTTGFDGQRG